MGMAQPGKLPHCYPDLHIRSALTSRRELRLWGIRRQDFRFSVTYNTPASEGLP